MNDHFRTGRGFVLRTIAAVRDIAQAAFNRAVWILTERRETPGERGLNRLRSATTGTTVRNGT